MEFDWSKYAGGSGDFVKFDEIGDTIEGTIIVIREHTFDKDKGPVPLIDLQPTEGEKVTLSVDKVDLRQKISEVAPQVGDKLGVRFVDKSKTPNGTMKVFAVKWKKGVPAETEWDDDGDAPPKDTPPLDDYSEPF